MPHVPRVSQVLPQEESALPPFHFATYVAVQRAWAFRTFGSGRRTAGLIKHIQKELVEIEESPSSLEEWIDVMILALDGACRLGASPEDIEDMLVYKQEKNLRRRWPVMSAQDTPIEHLREEE